LLWFSYVLLPVSAAVAEFSEFQGKVANVVKVYFNTNGTAADQN